MKPKHTPYEPSQYMGQDRYIIWSMSFDWEPEGDPNGRPVNFERANDFGEFPTLAEAQAALAALDWQDENWALEEGNPAPGSTVIWWIWRETPMAQRMVTVPEPIDTVHSKQIGGGDDAWALPRLPDEEV